ncbi:MAG: hypothetical protein CMJ29_10420 [Phycisphaerae bacterium]|nr:hypothetical protein [Phycisphaerae bacterium]|tara:strand:- start:1944 stop:2744 length:801 start_codon:yes stop_codon:yes gene_type:complete
MLASIILAGVLGSPFTEVNSTGNLYVFSTMGPWLEPDCRDSQSRSLDMAEILDGFSESAYCVSDGSFATALASARIELAPQGFSVMLDGGGETFEGGSEDVFSRHDINIWLEVAAAQDLRLQMNWSLVASGLASAMVQMQRMGDLDGENEFGQLAFEHTVSAYIDQIQLEGQDVIRVPQGRWMIRLNSTHQASAQDPGFESGAVWAGYNATSVPLGDVNGSGAVTVEDLLELLEVFGECEGCRADLDGNGQVDVTDLLQLLADWQN